MSLLSPDKQQKQKLSNKELFVRQVEKECCKEPERVENLRKLIANLENESLTEEAAIAEISNIFRVRPHLIKGINHWLPADKWVFVKKFKVFYVNGKECKVVKDLSEADEKMVKEIEEKLRRMMKRRKEKKEKREEESEDDFAMFEKELRDSEENSEKNEAEEQEKKKEKDERHYSGFRLLVGIVIFFGVIVLNGFYLNVFQQSVLNTRPAATKPSLIHLEQPQVVFHIQKYEKTSSCRLLRKELSNEDPNIVIFVFEAEMEQPWAKLTGNWSKYPYKFEKIEDYQDHSLPSSEPFIWDHPHSETRLFKYPVNVWKQRIFGIDIIDVEMKIETSAPIQQKSIKYSCWIDCDLKKQVDIEKERQKLNWNSMVSLTFKNQIENFFSELMLKIRVFIHVSLIRISFFYYNVMY